MPGELCRYYIAELVSVLEFMHSKQIVHRDLKPENILLNKNYHLKVVSLSNSTNLNQTDFGDSRQMNDEPEEEVIVADDDDRNSLFGDDEARGNRKSFVGTALYISPEMLLQNTFYPASDLWALGCIIYQLHLGVTPFTGSVDYEVFEKIQKRKISFPKELDKETIDIIDKLLQLNHEARLGAGEPGSKNDYAALKRHPYFKGIDFATLDKKLPPLAAERFSAYF